MNYTILFWIIGPMIFFLTKNPLTGPWKLIMVMLTLLWLTLDWFRLSRRETDYAIKQKLFDVVIFGLFLVGATNWFFSPFFFVLYLLSIAVTLVYSGAAGLGFVLSLVGMFVFNVGEVDVAYDSLVLLSLLLTFPLSLYLRREYLRLQENEKQILILEKEKQEAHDTVAKLLANTVNFTSAELREPLVNIKNYASLLLEETQDVKPKNYVQRIYDSVLIALGVVTQFEEEVTGRKIKSKG